MLKKHFKMLCTMALLSLFLQQSAIASTMYPNAFDNIFEKMHNDYMMLTPERKVISYSYKSYRKG